jgi:two-component system response regulator YesN
LYIVAAALGIVGLLGLALSTILAQRKRDHRARPEVRSRAKELATVAERYVKEHHGEPELSSAVVARKLFLSRRSLQMILKKEGKPPFRDMLTEFRLNRAEQLLLQTDKTVGEIAFEVGFNSPDALSVAFRRRRGMSPSDFRKQQNL